MTDDVIVDCEKVILNRLDGVSQIKFVNKDLICEGVRIFWNDNNTYIQAEHVGASKNDYLIFKEIEVTKQNKIFM